MSTPQQIAADCANAQLSTGPRTEEGKQRSSLNALKSGLTGRTVLLPTEDAAAYERHVAHFFAFYEPVGDEEIAIVQRMADTRWRLDRCANLENNLYALGHMEFKDLFAEESLETRRALIQAHTFRAYQKEFRNLNIQEGRLERSFNRDYARLTELQDARLQLEKEEYERELQLGKAAVAYSASIREGKPFDAAELGFDFSIEEIKARMLQASARNAQESSRLAA
jgi:hypothetical protein